MNDSEREEKLSAAKKKLKAFRAKKNATVVKRASSSSEEPVASTSRASSESPVRKNRHSHRKSSSRHSIPPAQAAPAGSSRRNSKHNRTDSICNVHSMVTEIAQPIDALNTWTFPKSPSVPSAMSPDMGSSPFASGSRNLQIRRASLQHPPLSPSAGSAVVQQSTSSLLARRTSLQPEMLSFTFSSPGMASTPMMSSLSGTLAAGPTAHSRRNSRHSRQMSIGTTRESLEMMAGQLNPAEATTPITDRKSALEVLEGRSPAVATADTAFDWNDPASVHPTSNKRSSWTSVMTPSSSANGIAQAGGRGAVDLGMLVEEEEDAEDHFANGSPRRRPQSLFLPSVSPSANIDGTTSDTLSPTEESSAPFSSTPARGFRPLSMVASPSVTSLAEAAKKSGLRSLTLSHGPATATSNSQRRSLMSSVGSSTANTSRASRRVSVGPASAAGKRSSISYRSATPTSRDSYASASSPAEAESSDRSLLMARIASLESDASTSAAKHRVLEAEVTANQAILRAKEVELGAVQAKVASLQAELQAHGDLGVRVVDLEAQLAEFDERYNAEVDALRERCKDAELERDDLKEDVDGWRSRCADLARNVERERARAEEERREGSAARDQVRKLGERLATASAASATAKATADEALAEAQAKLITEMREQIFSLAGQLERERAAHTATRVRLSGLPSHSAQDADDEMPNLFSDRESEAGSSVTSASAFAFNMTADTSISTMASDEIPPSRPQSFFQSKLSEVSGGVPVTLGGLQTLAEEEEEETEPEEPKEELPMLMDSMAPAHGQGFGGSTCSTSSEAMPKTPLDEAPPELDHARSHSFLKNWKFPMGSVQQVHIVSDEDNSFFGISQAQILPPLAVSAEAMALPPFAMADLVVDPDWESKRPAKAVEPVPTVTAKPLSRSTEAPAPVSVPKPKGRLSLANFGSLLSSYVAPPPAPAPIVAAKAEKHSKRDSLLFAGEGDERPPILLARTSGPRRVLTPAEVSRPNAGILAELDFTTGCACRSTRVIRI